MDFLFDLYSQLRVEEDFIRRIHKVKKIQDSFEIKVLINKELAWKEHDDGLIKWMERIYVPKDAKPKEDII